MDIMELALKHQSFSGLTCCKVTECHCKFFPGADRFTQMCDLFSTDWSQFFFNFYRIPIIDVFLVYLRYNNNFLHFLFFYLSFPSPPFTIHRTVGEGGGYVFISSLSIPLASQTLRHFGNYCREHNSAHSWQPDLNSSLWFPSAIH